MTFAVRKAHAINQLGIKLIAVAQHARCVIKEAAGVHQRVIKSYLDLTRSEPRQ